MKYRKKPIVIEAFRFGYHDEPDWWEEAIIEGSVYEVSDQMALIETLEGKMFVEEGDWVIQGIKGEIYPCKHDIFEASYERN